MYGISLAGSVFHFDRCPSNFELHLYFCNFPTLQADCRFPKLNPALFRALQSFYLSAFERAACLPASPTALPVLGSLQRQLYSSHIV